MEFLAGYLACSPDGCGGDGVLCRGAGDTDAPALIRRVTESVCEAGFEFGEPVQAFGGGVRDPGQDRADDLVLPPGDGPREAEQLGDVVVAGTPVVEGGQPVPDVALARLGAGDAGAQVQGVAEFLLGDPGGGDVLPGRVRLQDAGDLGELDGREVLQVAYQQVLDAVLGSPTGRAPYLPRLHAPHVAGHLTPGGHVEQVHAICAPGSIRAPRRRRWSTCRSPHPIASRQAGAACASQYARHSGPALHLPQQPLPAGQVKEQASTVCQQQVFPGIRLQPPPGRRCGARRCPGAPPRGGLIQHRVRRAANASCATGHDTPACRPPPPG